jgi:hypothetical protein
MPKTKPKPKSKGKGLSKKMGPFPTYVWLILGVVVLVIGYFYLKRKGTATPGSANQTIIPSGIITPNQGGGASGGVTPDNGSPNNFPTDYASQTDLLAAIAAIESSTAAAIASITFPTPQPTPANPSPSNPNPGQTTTPVPVATKPAITATSTKKPATAKTSSPTAPHAVTITSNKTGGSANKQQGIFAIH